MKDPTINNQMSYVEFIVFLCRISHGHYDGGPDQAELMYLKLDHLIPVFLGHIGLEPIW